MILPFVMNELKLCGYNYSDCKIKPVSLEIEIDNIGNNLRDICRDVCLNVSSDYELLYEIPLSFCMAFSEELDLNVVNIPFDIFAEYFPMYAMSYTNLTFKLTTNNFKSCVMHLTSEYNKTVWNCLEYVSQYITTYNVAPNKTSVNIKLSVHKGVFIETDNMNNINLMINDETKHYYNTKINNNIMYISCNSSKYDDKNINNDENMGLDIHVNPFSKLIIYGLSISIMRIVGGIGLSQSLKT